MQLAVVRMTDDSRETQSAARVARNQSQKIIPKKKCNKIHSATNSTTALLHPEITRSVSFEVARLDRKGEMFWPKAYPHRSLGRRPRT